MNKLRAESGTRYTCHHSTVRTAHGSLIFPSVFDSWVDFTKAQEHPDWSNGDYNLLVKWDWVGNILRLTYLHQSVGRISFVVVTVNDEDEAAVHNFLQRKFQFLAEQWSPCNGPA